MLPIVVMSGVRIRSLYPKAKAITTVVRDTLTASELPKRIVAQLGEGAGDDVYMAEARRLTPEDTDW